MRIEIKHLVTALSLSLAGIAGNASAAELVLIISNSDYDELKGERRIARKHDGIVENFQDQGYDVIEGADLTRLEMQGLVKRVDEVIAEYDGIVIFLSGNIVTDGNLTWLLPIDIAGDSAIEAAFGAPTLDLFLSMAASKPGHGFVFAGVADENTSRRSRLEMGVGDTEIPQGVLFVSGPSDKVASVLTDDLLTTDKPMSVVLAKASGVVVDGYVSPDFGLTAITAAEREQLADMQREERTLTPEDVEDALKLTRDERREVQVNLTDLGFDTRGVDGVFGRGSRGAIEDWQDSQDLDETGYLTASQVAELKRQGDARRLTIGAEDSRYWNATGISGREGDLRKYLDKYPNGLFAGQARESLAAFDTQSQTSADEEAWAKAALSNTAESYSEYLKQFPNGIYSKFAAQRVEEMAPAPTTNIVEDIAAKLQEDRLNLNKTTKLLIENRLKSAGFNPGRIDGVFDGDTRKAIKRYQSERGLAPTGYIDSKTVRALLFG